MEIKDAVRNAIAFAQDALGYERTASIRLEEIESSSVDNRPVWLVTLSTTSRPAVPAMALGLHEDRDYKVFTVAKDSGEVLSMRIRLLATPTM
jgi:hypothetical protein